MHDGGGGDTGHESRSGPGLRPKLSCAKGHLHPHPHLRTPTHTLPALINTYRIAYFSTERRINTYRLAENQHLQICIL